MKILVPSTQPFGATLPEGVTAYVYDVNAPIPPEHRDAEMLVMWANPKDRAAEFPAQLPNLRLVQTLAAGPDNALDAGFPESVPVASGRGLHDITVAEHALALALAAVRSLPDLVRSHDQATWNSALGGTAQASLPGVRSLHGARVTIWGFGSIAKHLAPLLTALGAHVRGIANSAGERNGYRVDASADRLAILPETDILIMIMPKTPETDGILGRTELDALPEHAIVINVGRGNAINEPELIAALNEGRIGAAMLDVTSVEPLPADNPLWQANNLFISPHAAGGRPIGSDELITAQVQALLNGTEIRNRVR